MHTFTNQANDERFLITTAISSIKENPLYVENVLRYLLATHYPVECKEPESDAMDIDSESDYQDSDDESEYDSDFSDDTIYEFSDDESEAGTEYDLESDYDSDDEDFDDGLEEISHRLSKLEIPKDIPCQISVRIPIIHV